MKKCNYCYKTRPEELFYKIKTGKNYEYKKMCQRCYSNYIRGKVFDNKARNWQTYTKLCKTQGIYKAKWKEKNRKSYPHLHSFT